MLGAQNVAISDLAIEMTIAYARERKAFGGVLWDKQAIRQRLAMLQSKVEAGRHLVYHAAWLDSLGRDCVKEVSPSWFSAGTRQSSK